MSEPMDDITITVEDGEFVLSGKLIADRVSKSGKSDLLLTTRGKFEVAGVVPGPKPLVVSLNVYQDRNGG